MPQVSLKARYKYKDLVTESMYGIAKYELAKHETQTFTYDLYL